MSKVIYLPYNGSVGWSAKLKDVHERLGILQPLDDFLNFKDPKTGLTNRKLILQTYDNKTLRSIDYVKWNDETQEYEKDESKDWEGGQVNENWPSPYPIVYAVESEFVSRSSLIDATNLVELSDEIYGFSGSQDGIGFSANLNSKFFKIRNEYVQSGDSQNIIQRSVAHEEDYKKENRKLTVWLWSKGLSENGKSFNKNSLMNITPFVLGLNTNVVRSGGTFNIQLAPALGELSCNDGEPEGIWRLDKRYYEVWKDNDDILNYVFKTYLNLSELVRQIETVDPEHTQNFQDIKYDDEIKMYSIENSDMYSAYRFLRNKIFFSNVISENDLIFISFNEKDDEFDYTEDFFLSVDNIQNKNWTMIGLVDNISTNFTAEATDVSISVSGRDMMKLLIEDGTFFFQNSHSNDENEDSIFGNIHIPRKGDSVNTSNKTVQGGDVANSVNRLVFSGLIETLFNQNARNVGFVLNLLMSRLANIEICPNEVFESYGDRRTRFQVETLESPKE